MAELLEGNLAPTVAEAGSPPPSPPKLVVGDRRLDATRLELVVPPTLAAELGDAEELRAHRSTFKRWQAADQLSRRNDVEFERDGISFKVHVPDEVQLKVELEIGDDGSELEVELTW
jgi:amphi-Trp domain-containing protein